MQVILVQPSQQKAVLSMVMLEHSLVMLTNLLALESNKVR